MRNILRIGIPLFIISVMILGGMLLLPRTEQTFSAQIGECYKLKSELRFSCFRNTIEKNYKGKDAEFSEYIKNIDDLEFQAGSEEVDPNLGKGQGDITYANFGTNCHTFYHAAGDFIATYASSDTSTLDMLKLGPNKCTSGYMMGIFKRTALRNNYDTEVLKDFLNACGDFGLHQCSHEIGHILHDKHTYSILQVLDNTTEKEYGYKYPEKYKYITTKNNDLDAPFEECREVVPEGELEYCFTGIGHNLFLFAQFSPNGFKEIFKECENVKEENREDCYGYIIYRYGQNMAGTKVLSGKVDEANKICEEVIQLSGYESTRKHCFIGIGGGIGLYADSEIVLLAPTKEGTEKARKLMHTFLGMCKKLNEEDIDSCIAGLFGTPFKKYYQKFLIDDDRAKEVLDKIDKDFQVVG